MKNFKFALIIVMMIPGCAIVSTTDKYADGRVSSTSAFELGRTEAISNFNDTQSKDGRSVSVGAAKTDVNVDALKQANSAIGSIIGAALKAYTGKP